MASSSSSSAAPRLTGDEAFDRGAQDDLAGVLARVITGYTGAGGTADLEFVGIGQYEEHTGRYRFVLRKLWDNPMGGPRIEHIQIRELDAIDDPPAGAGAAVILRHKEAIAERAEQGWRRGPCGEVCLRPNEWARTLDTFAGTSANSKMLANYFVDYALSDINLDMEDRGVNRVVNLRVFNLPETSLFMGILDKEVEVKKGMLQRLAGTWHRVTIPCGSK